MWSDTLLAAERAHLVQLLLWAASSVVLGTAVLALVSLRRMAAPIVYWFAMQALVWGFAELAVVAVRWGHLAMRDVSGATRLDRLTWFTAGLAMGIVVAGLTIAVAGWRSNRRLGAVGGGLGVVVQGLGLLVMNLAFAGVLARLI